MMGLFFVVIAKLGTVFMSVKTVSVLTHQPKFLGVKTINK